MDMRTPTFDSNRSCQNCALKGNGYLCHLTSAAASEFDSIKYLSLFPGGAVLFQESEAARGIFLLCSGQVKLSVSSREGKTLTLRLAKPGEILGLTATMSGSPYEASAETIHPCQVTFVRRQDFMNFINKYPEVYQAVIQQLNTQYRYACDQLRTMGLSPTAHGKLARLLLQWSAEGRETSEGTQIKVPLTHEQIAECVGSTRETVSRTLSEFKHQHLVILKGATIMIPSRAALEAICGA